MRRGGQSRQYPRCEHPRKVSIFGAQAEVSFVSWYFRTLSTADPTPYASLEAAAAEVQARVDMYKSRKRIVRTKEGKVSLHESDGTLFNVLWVEDEDGRVVQF